MFLPVFNSACVYYRCENGVYALKKVGERKAGNGPKVREASLVLKETKTEKNVHEGNERYMKHAKLIYEHSMKKEITNNSKKITLSAKENDNMKSRKKDRQTEHKWRENGQQVV